MMGSASFHRLLKFGWLNIWTAVFIDKSSFLSYDCLNVKVTVNFDCPLVHIKNVLKLIVRSPI